MRSPPDERDHAPTGVQRRPQRRTDRGRGQFLLGARRGRGRIEKTGGTAQRRERRAEHRALAL